MVQVDVAFCRQIFDDREVANTGRSLQRSDPILEGPFETQEMYAHRI